MDAPCWSFFLAVSSVIAEICVRQLSSTNVISVKDPRFFAHENKHFVPSDHSFSWMKDTFDTLRPFMEVDPHPEHPLHGQWSHHSEQPLLRGSLLPTPYPAPSFHPPPRNIQRSTRSSSRALYPPACSLDGVPQRPASRTAARRPARLGRASRPGLRSPAGVRPSAGTDFVFAGRSRMADHGACWVVTGRGPRVRRVIAAGGVTLDRRDHPRPPITARTRVITAVRGSDHCFPARMSDRQYEDERERERVSVCK